MISEILRKGYQHLAFNTLLCILEQNRCPIPALFFFFKYLTISVRLLSGLQPLQFSNLRPFASYLQPQPCSNLQEKSKQLFRGGEQLKNYECLEETSSPTYMLVNNGNLIPPSFPELFLLPEFHSTLSPVPQYLQDQSHALWDGYTGIQFLRTSHC